MAKALIQQFLWSRLIENAQEPYNKAYKSKGIWRVTSKGLCVVQGFCADTNSKVTSFSRLVDQSSRLMFLIQIERLAENDRMDSRKKYISSLFALMIASLPLRHNINNDVQMSHPVRLETGDTHSINSADTSSTLSTSDGTRGLSFSDFFPFMKVLPNDSVINSSLKNSHHFNRKTCFQQQKILLQNLNPSSKRFKMRSIFPSMLCCNWLLEFCTVASNDEAETIMTEFLNLGWISFFDKKNEHLTHVESSKSIILNLTQAGMEIVMGVSLDKYNKLTQSQHQFLHYDESDVSRKTSSKRSSITSSGTLGNHSDILMPTNIHFDEKETFKRSVYSLKAPTLPVLQTTSLRTASTSKSSSAVSTPALEKNATSYFDILPPSNSYLNNDTIDSSALIPATSTGDINRYRESNSLKLKTILKNEQLQLLFRDFLGDNYCVENFDFWKDYDKFLMNYQRQRSNGSANHRQLLEDAYILWDMYLKPGTLRELNIDHTLREDMAEDILKMLTLVHTYTSGKSKPVLVVSTQSPSESLLTVLNWFDKVNDQICKLMATDSIPRFIQTPEYKKAIEMVQLQKEEESLKSQQDAYDNIQSRSTIFTNDLDEFPHPPQRKVKETIYL